MNISDINKKAQMSTLVRIILFSIILVFLFFISRSIYKAFV